MKKSFEELHIMKSIVIKDELLDLFCTTAEKNILDID